MKTRIGALVGFLAMMAAPAYAATVTLFDFNSLADGDPNGMVDGYMNATLPGTHITGSVASKTWAGDDHVVGTLGPDGTFHPVTLGTTDNAAGYMGGANSVPRAGSQTTQFAPPSPNNDTFIMTNQATGNDVITVTFSTPVTLVSFDWQIFPDLTCPTPCLNRPDFKFVINNSAIPTFHYFGVDPGAPQDSQAGNAALGGGLTFLGSVAMPGGETAPQLIGTYVAPGGGTPNVTRLDFIDWPVAIGIDNLMVSRPTPPTTVPQPSVIMMLTLGGALLGWRLRRA